MKVAKEEAENIRTLAEDEEKAKYKQLSDELLKMKNLVEENPCSSYTTCLLSSTMK